METNKQTVEEIMENYDRGYKILEKLFPLSDVKLKEKLKKILGSSDMKIINNILSPSSVVEKTIRNENYDKITISFYDSIEISTFGIYFHPSPRKMVDFHTIILLDEILNEI